MGKGEGWVRLDRLEEIIRDYEEASKPPWPWIRKPSWSDVDWLIKEVQRLRRELEVSSHD
jgi:hypothetical protein